MIDIWEKLRQCVMIVVIVVIAPSVLGSCTDDSNSQSESDPKLSDSISDSVVAVSASIANPILVTLITSNTIQAESNLRSFSAVTRGIREAKLNVKRPGRIVAVNVSLGARLRTGETIISLDSVLEGLAVDAALAHTKAAEASREKAVKDLKRARELYGESGISESGLEKARLASQIATAKYDGAVAELGVARRYLAETKIVAPFGGEVSNLPYEVGETPPLGGIVAEVISRRNLIADVFFSAEEAQMFSSGMRANIHFPSDGGIQYHGRLRAISPKGNEVTKLFKGEVIIDNTYFTLRAGVTCRIRFVVNEVEYPLIPFSAIVSSVQAGSSMVAVASEHNVHGASIWRVNLRTVTTGGTIGSAIEIVSGLEYGEYVVVVGDHDLVENQVLNAVKEVPLDSLLH